MEYPRTPPPSAVQASIISQLRFKTLTDEVSYVISALQSKSVPKLKILSGGPLVVSFLFSCPSESMSRT